MNPDYVGLVFLSVFCVGGLVHYVPEALRLKRLLAVGIVRRATVTAKREVDSGSETVTHYLLTYEFTDEQGNTLVREDDLNDRHFFAGLSVGSQVEILHEPGPGGSAYPRDRIRADARIATWISAGLIALWVGLGAHLLFG